MGAMIDAAGLNPLQTLRAIAAWLKSRPENQDAENIRAQALEALEDKLRKQKAKIARLKNEAKKQGALADKVGVLQKIQDAERLQRTMRNQIFDVEDAIKAALSQKDASVMRDFSSTFPEAVAIVEKALSGRSGAEVDAKQGGHEPSSPQMVTVPQITGKIGPTTFPEHPDFKTYDEVQEWIAKRSSEVGLSKKSFAATHEYSHALPKIEAVYKAAKTQFDENQKERGEDALRQMADVGVKVGDTVAWTKTGAFLSQESYQGIVVMRGGIPHVKLADKITVSSGGKLRQTNYLPWKPYMLPKASANQSSVKNSDSATAVPIIKGRHNPVKTAKGTRVDTVLALVEANSLIVSHDPASGNENPAFPQELQPRDRGRDSSIQWVQKVAASLDPDSLGRTSRADTGAPIIGPDHVVESGNGRSMAVKLAYQRGTADDYRQWLVDEAGYFGFTPEQVEAMRQPVLVRLRTSDIDRKAFVVEANQDDKLTFTATERAKTDAKRLDSHLLGLFAPSEDGDVTAASNQRFVQGFLQSLGDAEAAQYLTKDGKPTVALVHRLRAAVFSKAYNDDRLLEMMADQTKPEIQNVLNALSAAAPRFIDAQGYSRAGTEDVASGMVDGIEQSLDQRVVDAIVQATNTLMAARGQQQDVAEYVKQLGMFEELPEGVPELAVFLAQNSRSAKKMAIAFKAMAEFVKQDAISQQSDNLFGDPEPPRMADVVAAANAAIEREYGPEDGGMIGLFDSASMTPIQTLRAIMAWLQTRNAVGQDDGLSDRYTDENYRYKDVAPDGAAEQAIRDAFQALPRVTLGEFYPITVQHNGRKQQFLASQRALKRSNQPNAALTLLQIRKGRMIAGADLQYIAHTYKLSGKNELTEVNVTPASDELIKRWSEAFLPAAEQVKPEAQQAPAKPEAAEPFEHAGLKISPYRHRAGGEIKDGWLVQTPENAEREARGERQIGGDSIYSSREEAILAADREANDWEDRKRLQQEQNEAEKVEREAMLARKEAVKGLTLSQIKKYDYLNEMVSYQGRPMTRRSYVEMLVSEGNEPNTFEESVIKPMSNRQFNRASAAEQRAHEQKMKRAGMKTVYCIGDYIVSKTLYEYAVEFSQRGGGEIGQMFDSASMTPLQTLKAIAAWLKSRNAPALVEHVTQRGKTLRGAVLTNVTKAEAQAIDPYTFRKDGGWFIRDKYLDENGQVMGQGAGNAAPSADEQPPANAGRDDPMDSQGGSGDSVFFDDENAPKAPYDKLNPAFSLKHDQAGIVDTVYDVADGKRKLEEALRGAFPGVKFTIKKSVSGHQVSWYDGPSKGLVDRVVGHFQGQGQVYLSSEQVNRKAPGLDVNQTVTVEKYKYSLMVAIDELGRTCNYNLGLIVTDRRLSDSFAWRILKDVAQSGPYSDPYPSGQGSVNAELDHNGKWYRIVEDYRNNGYFSDGNGRTGFFTVVDFLGSSASFLKYDPTGNYSVSGFAKEISEKRYNAHTAPIKRKRLNPGSESTQTPNAGAENVPTASNLLEQNRQGFTPQDPANEAFVRNGAGITGPGAGGPAQQADQPWDDGYPGDDLPDGGPDADGTQDDQPVSGADGRLDGPKGTAGSNRRGGGGGASVPRSPTQVRRNRAAAQGIKEAGGLSEEQAAAEGLPVSWGDKANVHDSLPALLPEQRDDVVQIEDRLINQNQNGILVTNGTGTGKTYTALGTMKRFVKAGRQNVLVVTMSDKIARDFVKSSRHLGLNLVQLEGTKDNGGPVGQPRQVITTYANFGQNEALGLIDWDLLVFDESHNLMQGKQSDVTAALSKMRALTGHYGGFDAWAYMRHGVNEPALDIDPKERTEEEQARVSAYWQRMAPLREAWKQNWKAQGPGRAKVLFLSATPFAYAQTLDYAEGYLFHFEEPSAPEDPAKGMRYNSGGSREQFYISNFGYRMRTNKLTQPDANVDVGMMERMFADKLIKSGAMFGRQLTVPFDYDRKFIKVGSGIGQKIEEGLTFLSECNGQDGKPNLGRLSEYFRKNLDYTTRRQLLESIKADGAIGYIRKSMAMGRKVVVFHDYNKGGASNPFSLHGMKGVVDPSVKDQFEQFAKLRPDLVGMQISLPSAVGVLTRAFPDALVFSGKVAKGQRSKQADLFNQDGSGKNLIIVQSDAGATGISFHDTTGKHQRVIVNLGMPNKPAKVRQTEGRIYRVGQASNAIHRYLTIGTSWEESAFANSIAEKAETVDNLAMGEGGQASIKQALIDAYYSPVPAHPSVLDGTGGKADEEQRATEAKKSEFDQAITLYYSKGKVTDRRNNREGSDWYATPDPVGLMMMKWSGAHVGDRVLEPSAGDGAIARWSPKGTKLDMVEQTESLAARAKLANTDGNVIVGNFEDLHVTNKYESIVMNPPFGVGGKMAMEHVAKAFSHLPYGGRIVALVPTGQMDRRLMDWLSETPEAAVIAKIKLPGCTFERAGTGVMTQIVIIDRLDVEEANQVFPKNITLDHIEDIKTLFERIKEIDVPKRDKRPDEMLAEWGLTVTVDRGKYFFDGPGMKSDAVRKIVINDSAVDYERKKIDGNDVWFWYSRYDVTNRIIGALKKAGVPLLAA